MEASVFDSSLDGIRRQIVSVEELSDDSVVSDTSTEVFCSFESKNDLIEGQYLNLSQYSREELQLLSKSLGKSRLASLEIEGVPELDWDAILNQNNCTLEDVRVIIKSSRGLENLARALCKNTSLKLLELDYHHLDDDLSEETIEEQYHIPKHTIGSSFSLNEIFFEALMPLEHVILRGITPMTPSREFYNNLDHATKCSWRHLTIEDCDLTQENNQWLSSCITNLEEIVIKNCELSGATIQVLSEAYLTASAFKSHDFSRNSRRGRRRKNPLKVLILSNNDWLLSSNDENTDAQYVHVHDCLKDERESFNFGNYLEERTTMSSPSCMSILSSWLDSLSNLVELDLSNNPSLFHMGTEHGERGMDDLCGTVNQSLKRLSLRNCRLTPNDLSQIVNTFCWLEAIDLSENPRIISKISIISQLEYLTELVLENLIDYGTNETFEFERRMSDEELDWEAHGDEITDLLLELLNCENANFPDEYLRQRVFRTHRQKPLQRLNLSGNILSKKTLKILSLFDSLEVLILMGCQINSDGIIELLSSINNCTLRTSPLKELYLASNVIGDIGILTLAQSIKDQSLPLLKFLNLESNVISLEAFRVFVEEGLEHSHRIQYVQVSDDGAITSNQQYAWSEIEQKMEHILLLNQAGRFTLFVDGNFNLDGKYNSEEGLLYSCGNEGNDTTRKNKIPSDMWPSILENADSIYGTDALFYFLQKRPDLFASRKSPISNLYHSTPNKFIPNNVRSPNGVEDIRSFIT